MNLCWSLVRPDLVRGIHLLRVVVWTPLEMSQLIGIGMFAMWMLVVFYFFARVRYNLRAANAPIHLNPFL